jgi:hypothetical protein
MKSVLGKQMDSRLRPSKTFAYFVIVTPGPNSMHMLACMKAEKDAGAGQGDK